MPYNMKIVLRPQINVAITLCHLLSLLTHSVLVQLAKLISAVTHGYAGALKSEPLKFLEYCTSHIPIL